MRRYLNLGKKCCAHIHGYLPSIVFRTGGPPSPELKQFYEDVIHRIVSQADRSGNLRNGPTKSIYHMSEEKGRYEWLQRVHQMPARIQLYLRLLSRV